MYCEDPPPGCFFIDAYHEVHPTEPGWQKRMDLLHFRVAQHSRGLW